MALDPHDGATALLPGVTPAPIKPPRTNYDDRMRASGFKFASKRDSCGNCKHCDARLHNTGSFCESQTFYCDLHRFTVGKHAICNDHERLRGSS